MRRLFLLALPVLFGLAVSARAGLPCGCKTHCIEPPEDNPNCKCPCEKRLNLCLFGKDHAHKYLDKLNCDETCCVRIKAVKKLGSRLCADFCNDPDVLEALISALFYDPCWLVRKEAAWSIHGQSAYTDEALLALYISSKIDPHVMVRARAAEALDLLTLCRRKCYKDLYAFGDKVIVELKAKKFIPGRPDAREKYALVNFPALGSPPGRSSGIPVSPGGPGTNPDPGEGALPPRGGDRPRNPAPDEINVFPKPAEVIPAPALLMQRGQ
ncbi:MAG: HEAT repeat domain-containing protein [Planctomycetes bacterium]|nr:HEAT repeat domain-containing protein [Planctomycetota bacterium]